MLAAGDATGGAYSAPPDHLAGFNGGRFVAEREGQGGQGRKEGKRGKGKRGKERKEEERKGFTAETPVDTHAQGTFINAPKSNGISTAVQLRFSQDIHVLLTFVLPANY